MKYSSIYYLWYSCHYVIICDGIVMSLSCNSQEIKKFKNQVSINFRESFQSITVFAKNAPSYMFETPS